MKWMRHDAFCGFATSCLILIAMSFTWTKGAVLNSLHHQAPRHLRIPALKIEKDAETQAEAPAPTVSLATLGIEDSNSTDSQVSKPVVVVLRGSGGGSKPTTKKPVNPVNDEDIKVRKEWGGSCLNSHWMKCATEHTFGQDIFGESQEEKLFSKVNCDDPQHVTEFPPLCMHNGWTVTRCHLLCMSQECNKDIFKNYEQYVKKEGFC